MLQSKIVKRKNGILSKVYTGSNYWHLIVMVITVLDTSKHSTPCQYCDDWTLSRHMFQCHRLIHYSKCEQQIVWILFRSVHPCSSDGSVTTTQRAQVWFPAGDLLLCDNINMQVTELESTKIDLHYAADQYHTVSSGEKVLHHFSTCSIASHAHSMSGAK